MVKIKIDSERCKGCMICIAACPVKIIKESTSLNRKGLIYATVDANRCTGCGVCFQVCPDLAIEIEK